jgi:hypothetical protein
LQKEKIEKDFAKLKEDKASLLAEQKAKEEVLERLKSEKKVLIGQVCFLFPAHIFLLTYWYYSQQEKSEKEIAQLKAAADDFAQEKVHSK